jgi:hypothetical protein
VVFDTVALMLLGREVEPIWGSAEFIKFIMVRELPAERESRWWAGVENEPLSVLYGAAWC